MRIAVCYQGSCTGEIDIGSDTLDSLKKGQTMSILLRVAGGDPSGRDLTLNVPLKDFGPGFDGRPTDPQVLQQQRQQMQQRFQMRAEEQRRYMQQQGGYMQQQGGPPGPPPGAPAR